ncbi:MAG: hypothetical protein SA339_13880 [Methanomassiliicoccus sp.]|nr:hypothetical protein [Methanomassiliicoccus sp.]
MDRVMKQVVSCVALALAIISILAAFLLFSQVSSSIQPLLSLSVVISVIVMVIAAIGIFNFSTTGWEVEGSTFEWIVAAIISPFTAISMYILGGRSRGRD